ncbi:MAG TPA: pyruvate:ferredoxin (flavodoxin) oxidoreductase [Verrucomicrobiota bacterium]|jgi:pyruvate-ferredoxin/flavodoxin oxidoreductase|nr:MAG: Pyruvate-flavodoxin oxidoreductase [Verrucomicrobia bacterium ADurb.Bin118]HPY31258.1 pyruvate:ferredoxin (flavodoxin) oxidoreductase [Verrucomicrobiota bacterium]HQB17656.1 pyruvate:ferredoxin (flavodoxin) oxidoreductase [Verrucomicrobiota bacterium]
MSNKTYLTVDGNEAVAYVSYRLNEVMAIYPITPSSPMGEWCDQWASEGKRNLWDTIPSVVAMQSEGGAAGALHGALQTGALANTFTASQGLLLKIPNMYKIAGELLPTVFHITARTLATHALSIFGDHSDIMAVRQTGFALLGSASVQEAMDLALIAQAATFKSRVPFVHFFDGFRTSHEVQKIQVIPDDVMLSMMDLEAIQAHRNRAMSPDRPVLRGTAQNPDAFFQGREACNPFYDACPDIVQQVMDEFAQKVGRTYQLFQYVGAPDAERIVILMGSGCETAHETVDYLVGKGEKVGVLKVRLYRPFDMKRFIEAIPASVQKIAVLDRTKEPGAAGEPLYQDCIAALYEGLAKGWGQLKTMPKVIGGRYGLSSKEFTPAMVKAVFDNLASAQPKEHFTVGIQDDVSQTSLPFDPEFSTEGDQVVRAMFYGLGADGTVGANKNSIKIIGEGTDNYAQGYFVYDSKKSGSMTVSHLRFGPQEIRSTYLVSHANFVACHQPVFLERHKVTQPLIAGGIFLLNTPYSKDEVWEKLPKVIQEDLVTKRAKFYVIDAIKVAHASGMGGRINTIMQVCFFALAGVLPRDAAIEAIKLSIKKTYGKKGEEVVRKNIEAVDNTLANLHEVPVPGVVSSTESLAPGVTKDAPAYVREVLGKLALNLGDELPVSVFPVDGSFPTATARYEKRNLALEIPVWDEKICIQCGKCVAICPHATIRMKVYDPKCLEGAPATFKSTDARNPEWKGLKYTLQVAAEDCTGCALCVDVCPAKNKQEARLKAINMRPQAPLRLDERDNWNFFLGLPEMDRRKIKVTQLRSQQIMQPLFEFSGACSGCGETPYIKMLSQLFGDRLLIANATGCSSIYGGNLPTTPYAQDACGRGPAWCNSLFEDNAEFGLGFRVSLDKQKEFAAELVKKLAPVLGDDLVDGIVNAVQQDETGIYDQRERVAALKQKLQGATSHEAKLLLPIADTLVKRSVWIIGGDGWAYDIGYGGLDHVLASGRNVNVLVLDTEVYSNTGGQASKATPRGAVAKFAAGGKPLAKKDLGLICMTYGNIYVASVAMGAKDEHTLRAFVEAESYDGPSIIIAYSHCIAHGVAIDMGVGAKQQKALVDTGQWLLYRFDPRRAGRGENPLQLDSSAAKAKVQEYLLTENRFKMLTKSKPEEAKRLFEKAQTDADLRWQFYAHLASRKLEGGAEPVTALAK